MVFNEEEHYVLPIHLRGWKFSYQTIHLYSSFSQMGGDLAALIYLSSCSFWASHSVYIPFFESHKMIRSFRSAVVILQAMKSSAACAPLKAWVQRGRRVGLRNCWPLKWRTFSALAGEVRDRGQRSRLLRLLQMPGKFEGQRSQRLLSIASVWVIHYKDWTPLVEGLGRHADLGVGEQIFDFWDDFPRSALHHLPILNCPGELDV